MSFFAGFLVGILFFIFYGGYRATNSDGWDDSNLFNWLRLLAHVFLHPEDFGRMYYIDKEGEIAGRPFDYISKDEITEVVKSRP